MKNCRILTIILFMALGLSVGLSNPDAQASRSRTKQQAANPLNNFVTQSKYASLVVNTDTGTIIHAENADAKRYPASLTKLMTLYLTFESIKHNRLKMSDYAVVSRHAASQPRMSLDLKPGQQIQVKTLISSLVVVSANDSAVVLAEKIGHTERNFAALMTTRARQLGMKDTNFINASGLFNKKQVTTAKDLAKLMMALKRDFPEYYPLLSQKQFSYNRMDYGCHTTVTSDYPWAKTAKTGYVRQSGFNLVIGAEKDNKDIVAVVMGGQTARKRDALMMGLLDQSFKKIPTVSNVTTTKPAETSMNNVSDDTIDQQISTSNSQQASTPTTAKPASFTQPKSRFALNQR